MSLLPQFGFIELLVVAVVALIVVGPKDLPVLLRKIGQMLGQAKRMAGEFTSAFDQMAREAEMDELRAEMEALKKANPIAEFKDEVDLAFKPVGDAVRKTMDDGKAIHGSGNGANEAASVKELSAGTKPGQGAASASPASGQATEPLAEPAAGSVDAPAKSAGADPGPLQRSKPTPTPTPASTR